MKKNAAKIIILVSIAIVVLLLVLLIYKNVFGSSNQARNKDISKYKITENEINVTKEKITKLGDIESIDIHTNNESRIIKIVVIIKDDIDFEEVKKNAIESIKGFSEKNIEYYDIEYFIDSKKEDSEVYPKIGYKFKTNSDFSWSGDFTNEEE